MCELIGRRSPRYLNFFSNLFIVGCLYTHQHMLWIIAIVDCTHVHHVSTTKYSEHTNLVTIVDCTLVGSATVSVKDGRTTPFTTEI